MTDEVENLVLEQLRLIRASLQKVEFDVADLKVRLSVAGGAQYLATARTAFSTSGVPGRICSSRTGA